MTSRQSQGALCVAAAATLWGLWPVWVRGEAGGKATAALALCCGGLLGLPLALREGRGRAARGRTAWLLLGALAVSNALNSWFYFRALDEGAVAPAVLSHYLAPVLVALAAPLALGEPRSRRTPLALALALGGTSARLFGRAGGAAGDVGHAVALGGASAVFYAANVLLSKRLSRDFGNAEMFAYHALIGGALLAAVADLPAPGEAWLRPIAGGLVSALLPGLVYYAGLRRLAAERAGVLTYLEIPAAAVVGWIAFAEAPGAGALVGGLLILAAGILVVGDGGS